jgi:hypothetical protein
VVIVPSGFTTYGEPARRKGGAGGLTARLGLTAEELTPTPRRPLARVSGYLQSGGVPLVKALLAMFGV